MINWESMFLPTEDGELCTLKMMVCVQKNFQSTAEGKMLTLINIWLSGNLYSWISVDDAYLYVYGMTEIDPIVAAFNKESGEQTIFSVHNIYFISVLRWRDR